jgi:glucans biosynthesis protein C
MSICELPQARLDAVRGAACVMLVAYHVVGTDVGSGLRLPESSAWHYAMSSLEFFRMPLFAILSGFVYAIWRPNRQDLASFWGKKVRRIVVPLVFATLTTVVLRGLTYDSWTAPSDALFFHYQHFWFLQSLLIIFAVVSICDAARPAGWVGLTIAATTCLMVSRAIALPTFMSLDGAFYLAPFFCFGMIVRIEPVLLRSRLVLVLAIGCAAIILSFQQLGLWAVTETIDRRSFAAALCGASAAVIALVGMPRIAVLEQIGVSSYTIFLWHSIAGAAVRSQLLSLGIDSVALLFVILLAAGIGLPMLLQRLFADILPLSILVSGRAPARVQTPILPETSPAYVPV